MATSALVVTAWLAMLGCLMSGGLGFLVGLRDAGAKAGTVGGLLIALMIGGVYSALVWVWVLYFGQAST